MPIGEKISKIFIKIFCVIHNSLIEPHFVIKGIIYLSLVKSYFNTAIGVATAFIDIICNSNRIFVLLYDMKALKPFTFKMYFMGCLSTIILKLVHFKSLFLAQLIYSLTFTNIVLTTQKHCE